MNELTEMCTFRQGGRGSVHTTSIPGDISAQLLTFPILHLCINIVARALEKNYKSVSMTFYEI